MRKKSLGGLKKNSLMAQKSSTNLQRRRVRQHSPQQLIPNTFQFGTRTRSEKLVSFEGSSTDVYYRYPPLKPFTHYEHGKDAEPTFNDLLDEAISVNSITPLIGTEIHGVQISSLNNKGKDQLALLTAQRKVLGKCLTHLCLTHSCCDKLIALMLLSQSFTIRNFQIFLLKQYFGRLHVHPTSGAPTGNPEVHLVHRGVDDNTALDLFQTRTNSVTWHSDITYENQPPGTTFLYVLDTPKEGGDTLFSSQVEAYNRLLPEFQKRLHGLTAEHSSEVKIL